MRFNGCLIICFIITNQFISSIPNVGCLRDLLFQRALTTTSRNTATTTYDTTNTPVPIRDRVTALHPLSPPAGLESRWYSITSGQILMEAAPLVQGSDTLYKMPQFTYFEGHVKADTCRVYFQILSCWTAIPSRSWFLWTPNLSVYKGLTYAWLSWPLFIINFSWAVYRDESMTNPTTTR